MEKTTKTIGYYLSFTALGLVAASLGPTIPGLAEHTHTQLSEISFLFSARSGGYLLGSQTSGRLYDRLPGHTVLILGLLVVSGMMALVPVIPLLWLLTLVLFITGIAEGCVDIGGNTLLVWVYGRDVGPYMNALHFFFGLGAFISPIIVAQAVIRSGDINWAYWLLALLMLPPVLWNFRNESPVPAVVNKPTQDNPSLPAGPKPFLIPLIGMFFFLYVGAEVSFGGWIFTYATERGLSDATNAAYLTSIFWGALTAGRLLSIPIAMRVRPRTILLIDLLGSLASVGSILIWPNSPLVLWGGALGTGVFMASIFPTLLSLAERRMTITGQITGWFFFGVGAGGMTVPWIIGQLFQTSGAQITMIVILIDLISAMAIFFTLMAYSPQPATEENTSKNHALSG
jgi:FHS family Na+ dependent glucose MFS transporter 1